jgi:hypothetical protein
MTAILQGMPFVFADELLKNLRRAAWADAACRQPLAEQQLDEAGENQ